MILPKSRQIGLDAEELLRSSQGEPEAGYDLVEDEEDVVLLRQPSHCLKIALLGQNRADVS